jgi:hypothetical protein
MEQQNKDWLTSDGKHLFSVCYLRLGRSKHICEYNIKMDIREISFIVWIVEQRERARFQSQMCYSISEYTLVTCSSFVLDR